MGLTGINIEQIIVDELGEEMRTAMDFEILSDVFVRFGWSAITVEYGPNKRWDDVIAWYDNNCRGDYREHKGRWVIERPQDATIFALKWS